MPFSPGGGNVTHYALKPRKFPENVGDQWRKQRKELQEVLSTVKQSAGRDCQQKYLSGENINKTEAMLAKCAECCGWYADGKKDCEVPTCAIYPWMPYKTRK
jgi:hypothetical protein